MKKTPLWFDGETTTRINTYDGFRKPFKVTVACINVAEAWKRGCSALFHNQPGYLSAAGHVGE
jgi:hypothetical protein